MHSSTDRRRLSILLAFALVVGLVLLLRPTPAVAQSCSYNGELQLNPEELAASEPVQGNPEAEVLLTEFFDPNCPHCQRFKPVMDEVMQEYGDQVRYYKQPVPLWQYSRRQIRALLIAKEQNKYYEFIDQQLQNPAARGGLSREQILSQAEAVGIDRDWMAEQLAGGTKRSDVNRLPYEARKAGVESTPTLAIGKKVVGNRSAACIGRLIERELEAQSETPSSDDR